MTKEILAKASQYDWSIEEYKKMLALMKEPANSHKDAISLVVRVSVDNFPELSEKLGHIRNILIQIFEDHIKDLETKLADL